MYISDWKYIVFNVLKIKKKNIVTVNIEVENLKSFQSVAHTKRI